MGYLPKRRWSTLEKKIANIMIKAIDKQLKERRMMRSLENQNWRDLPRDIPLDSIEVLRALAAPWRVFYNPGYQLIAPEVTSYDYIIVGGGTSGCALAATLSQGAKVLVLERGDLPYDGVVNQRARVLGGGSALNSGFFSKAEPDFINKAGLDPKLVRESYEWVAKKVEFEPKVLAWQGAVRDGLLEAGVLPNNGFTLEHLYGTKVGGSIFDKNGRRHTAADLLEYEPEAIGVLYKDKKGKEHTAVLNEGSSLNEVILTAGTLVSLQLLMLSGIGPSEQLTAHEIKVVLHQPMTPNIDEIISIIERCWNSDLSELNAGVILEKVTGKFVRMTNETNVTAPVNVTGAPVTNTVANHAEKPEEFNGQNFKRWQQKMFFYLTTLNHARFLNETAPQVEPPAEGQPSNAQAVQAVEAWRHSEFLCHTYILNGLVDSLYNVCCKTTTVKEIWESLECKYKTKDAGTKKFVVARFLDYKMDDSKTVITQVQDLQVLLHDIHAEGMTLSETFQVAAIIEKLPPSWVEFKNYLKHKRKEMSVEDLVVRLCIEEDNKLAQKNTYTSDSAKANMVEHVGSSSKSNSKATGKGKKKNDKKSKGKAEYLAPKAGIVKQKFQGTCYNCDQPGHRAANCKMPKRVNPRQANMVNDNVDMIAMVSDVIAMISEVNLVGSNNSGWWVDTGATRHVCWQEYVSLFQSD
ncbi:pol polyprotein [Tanacetum coccineum]